MYEKMHQECKHRFRGGQTGCCTHCGTVIKLDMAQHVATFHLDLAQLWRCLVSWCTQWKGTRHRTVLYGGRPPLAPVSMWMSHFVDKVFTPFKTQSGLVATRPYPSSPESRASTACFDLDVFVSGSSQGYSPTSMVGRDRGSVSSGTSSVDEQSDLLCEPSRFQPLNSPVSPIADIGSQIVVESPSHYEAPDVPVVDLTLFDTVTHMSQVSALSSVLLSPNRVHEDCTSGATDIFPIYQVSLGNTGYLPVTSPIMPPIPDCLPIPPGLEQLGRLTASSD